MLASLSVSLGLLYGVLGQRGAKFVEMHYRVISNLEAKLPEHLRTTGYVVNLQRGLYADESGEAPIRLSRIEQARITSHHLLWLVPYSFAVVSVVLIFLSLPN